MISISEFVEDSKEFYESSKILKIYSNKVFDELLALTSKASVYLIQKNHEKCYKNEDLKFPEIP